MGESQSKLQLADRLIGQFNRVAGAEMPSRVLVFPEALPGRRRPPSAQAGSWGGHPIVLLAVDMPVVLRAESRDSIQLRVGEATLMTARDALDLQPGGAGKLIGLETLGTQPCRFFEMDAADPVGSRDEIELFCMPFSDDLPVCWKACHEIHCLLESAQRYASTAEGATEPAICSVLRLANIECARALECFRETVNGPVEKSNAARVAAAEVFVSCNIERDIRKSELAAHLGVSVSQLTLAFREIGHLAVRDRIRFRRVESARNLLAETMMSVSEVAEKVGMNYRHFIRAFRQNALLTPLRYRKYARRDVKAPEVMSEFLHTANFDLVEPLESLNGDRDHQPGQAKNGAISVLISNASRDPLLVSRLGDDGVFVDLGLVAGEKRLSFLDSPGSLWKLGPRPSASDAGVGAEAVFFESGETNSHFVYGLASQR